MWGSTGFDNQITGYQSFLETHLLHRLHDPAIASHINLMQSHIDKEPSGFVHLLVSFYTYPSGAEGQLKRVLADVNDFVEFDSQIKSHTLEFC